MGGCHVKKNVGFLREAWEWSKGALFGGGEGGPFFNFWTSINLTYNVEFEQRLHIRDLHIKSFP